MNTPHPWCKGTDSTKLYLSRKIKPVLLLANKVGKFLIGYDLNYLSCVFKLIS